MKKIFFALLMIAILTSVPLTSHASGIEERNLPDEAPPPQNELDKIPVPSTYFQGFANSRDVTIVGGVMSVVYYFCEENRKDFCSDQEGILVVTGAETGKIPEIIKLLDVALERDEKIIVRLAVDEKIAGVNAIIDVKSLGGSI